jgi:hypothetical protein
MQVVPVCCRLRVKNYRLVNSRTRLLKKKPLYKILR